MHFERHRVFFSSELQTLDNILRDITSCITNINFHDNNSAWIQATLPVGYGGLGIRSPVQLAPSAFLASAAGSSNLVSQILPNHLQNHNCLHMNEALSVWTQGHKQALPTGSTSHRQKEWDIPRVKAMEKVLLDNAPDARSRARLLSASTKESGAWLNAIPSSSLGLRMDNDTIRVAVALCLGTSLCQPHLCCHCGLEVDHLATQ